MTTAEIHNKLPVLRHLYRCENAKLKTNVSVTELDVMKINLISLEIRELERGLRLIKSEKKGS